MPTNTRTQTLFLILAISVTFFIYRPGLQGGFVFDDTINIIENTKLNITSLDFPSLWEASTSSSAGALGRPLSMLTFTLNEYFFDKTAFSYKVTNLLIHITNGILIYIFLHILIKNTTITNNLKEFNYLPTLVTAAWLLSPINLTSVLYIVQRMTSLASLFVLAGVIFYIWNRKRFKYSNRYKIYLYLFLVLFTTLAILSKENGVLLIPYIFLIEVCIFKFKTNGKRDISIISFFIIFLALPLLLLLLILIVSPDFFLKGYELREFTMGERVMTEARVLWFYIYMILLPNNSSLGLFHDDIMLSTALFFPASTLPSIIGIIFLILATIIAIKKHPLVALGIGWFLISHSIESTILQLEIAHEHRNYLASMGILLAVFAFLLEKMKSSALQKLKWAIISILIVNYTTTTYFRVNIWSSPVDHALYEAAHHPKSVRALIDAGKIHMSLAKLGDKQSIETGKELLTRAQQLDKTGINADIILFIWSNIIEKKPDLHWINTAKKKLSVNTRTHHHTNALDSLLLCYKDKVCDIDKDSIYNLLKLSASEKSYISYLLLATFEANHMNDLDSAYKSLSTSIHIEPNDVKVRVNMVNLLLRMGKIKEAKKELELAINTDKIGSHSNHLERLEQQVNLRPPTD